jgi:hypothetical protein
MHTNKHPLRTNAYASGCISQKTDSKDSDTVTLPTLGPNSVFGKLHTLWYIGNSSHSIQVFRMRKKAIRIIMGHGNRESCRNLFEALKILPLMSQYKLSLLTFVSNNRVQYFANSEIHNINTRHTSNLHLPRAHMNIYQKGVYYLGIKIFNSLPGHQNIQ